MRSIIFSVLATLAFALFSYAAPTPVGPSPVNAIAARGDDHEHTKSVSLEVVLNAAIEVITPITEELGECWISGSSSAASDCEIGCLKAEDATLEVVVAIVVKLKVAVEGVIVDVKALASLPLDRILCTLVGGVLDAVAIAKLLACLLNASAFGFSFGSSSLTLFTARLRCFRFHSRCCHRLRQDPDHPPPR